MGLFLSHKNHFSGPLNHPTLYQSGYDLYLRKRSKRCSKSLDMTLTIAAAA